MNIAAKRLPSPEKNLEIDSHAFTHNPMTFREIFVIPALALTMYRAQVEQIEFGITSSHKEYFSDFL
jgi:hypothetical protein